MWRDPLDELIEDLEQVVKPTPAIRQIAPFELIIEVTDRSIRARPYAHSEPKDDPKIDVLVARLKAYSEQPWPAPPSPGPTSDIGNKNDPTSPGTAPRGE